MVKIYTMVVNHCLACPNRHNSTTKDAVDYCGAMEYKDITDDECTPDLYFPKWCPLKDQQESK